jgi:hypothetical protein
MANTANPLIPVDGVITISDGAALTLTVNYEDGNLAISGLNGQNQKSYQSFKSRGKTYAVRAVEDTDIEFSFDAHAVHILGDGTTGTLGDAALKKAVWAAATSKLATANGDAYLLQVSWRGERTNFGATNDNVITMKYCALTMDFAEGVPGKLSIKGICYPISTDYLTIT